MLSRRPAFPVDIEVDFARARLWGQIGFGYAIVSSAGWGGSISPSGTVYVSPGGDQTFTVVPDPGYSVSSVLVDGISRGAVTSYTFTNVQGNHTISATFVIFGPIFPKNILFYGTILSLGGVDRGSTRVFHVIVLWSGATQMQINNVSIFGTNNWTLPITMPQTFYSASANVNGSASVEVTLIVPHNANITSQAITFVFTCQSGNTQASVNCLVQFDVTIPPFLNPAQQVETAIGFGSRSSFRLCSILWKKTQKTSVTRVNYSSISYCCILASSREMKRNNEAQNSSLVNSSSFGFILHFAENHAGLNYHNHRRLLNMDPHIHAQLALDIRFHNGLHGRVVRVLQISLITRVNYSVLKGGARAKR
jgi:hypothetical protein